MSLPHRCTTKILFTLHPHHHRSTANNQSCHLPFHPPNSRLSLPKPSPPKLPHTVCTKIHHSRHATLQIRKSAANAPPFDHYRVENTHTLAHDSFQALTPTSALERVSSPRQASTSSAGMSKTSHFRWRLALRG